MKIDFHGRFLEIRRLLDSAPVKQDSKRAEFQTLLSEVNPHNPKPKKIQGVESESAQQGQGAEAGKGPMASFRFTPPEMSLPELIRQSPPTPAEPEVSEESVKSPTVLGVTRREDSEPPQEAVSQVPRAERVARVRELVNEAGIQHGIDPVLGMAVASAESSFDPNAVSQDGHYSKGLFQLLDTTAANIIERAGLEPSYDPFNPEQNVDLGVRYLRYLHGLFSEGTKLPNNYETRVAANSADLEKLAVAAYNAGEGRVASAQHRAEEAGLDPSRYDQISRYLPRITQEYVERVMRRKGEFE